MQVTQTNADGLKHAFKIVVPAGDIGNKVESRLKEVATRVSIAGFRPGKVPMSIVRKRYAASIMGEVLEDAVQGGVRSTLEQKKLTPAAQPKIEVVSFDEGKDLEFTMEFEALPEIGETDFAVVQLVKPVVEFDDSEVEEALVRIAQSRKVSEVVEEARKAETGNILEIDFVGRIDGEEFPGGKGESYDLELGSGSFIPGFEEQLVGAKPGDSVTVTVTFPESYHAKDLAGKEAAFDVNVKALKQAKVPELDDTFAKSAGFDDMVALRNAVREQIRSDYDNLARGRMKRELLDKLSEMVSFPVPQGMINAEFSGIWPEIEAAMKNDALEEEDKGKSEDDLRAEYTAIAERRVRLGLLLADTGRRNEVQVTQEDLNHAVMREAMRYPGQERAVFQYFQSNKQALDQLRAPIYEDKVVDLILGKVTCTDQKMSPAELMETGEDSPAPKKVAKKKASKKSGAAAE
ncbi:trigger factor [Haematospirillum sp. H1815]|uniref:trigger factor n=1 Tax=Haematospirillum sp. H1815 TaxID=2723108 RepID=UPI0014387FC1|nr:trigger factor [Haematospirillum sp. H1815]NKD76388.1 trigger factor [Haematospirillum sp. H1815]